MKRAARGDVDLVVDVEHAVVMTANDVNERAALEDA
jgi:hypothetical protein